MALDVAEIWKELEEAADHEGDSTARVYRALGETAIGIRAAYIPQTRILELLIEVPSGWEGRKSLPAWRGMRFEILPLSLGPRPDEHQLRLYLDDHEHRPIFLTFCRDLVGVLEGISDPAARVHEIEDCIARWGRFFEKCGPEGLSPPEQRGLFAELEWMARLLRGGVATTDSVGSWKGCERGYHDFDLGGHIVEVKSTMTKEPRSIRVSNERQLDDRGLLSLHLYVVTLHSIEGGGTTLPEKIDELRAALQGSGSAESKFERCLVNAGYLDGHAGLYVAHYIIKAEELFEVTEGFPRIVDMPSGTGRLRYSVEISACKPHEADADLYLQTLLLGGSDAG